MDAIRHTPGKTSVHLAFRSVNPTGAFGSGEYTTSPGVIAPMTKLDTTPLSRDDTSDVASNSEPNELTSSDTISRVEAPASTSSASVTDP